MVANREDRDLEDKGQSPRALPPYPAVSLGSPQAFVTMVTCQGTLLPPSPTTTLLPRPNSKITLPFSACKISHTWVHSGQEIDWDPKITPA